METRPRPLPFILVGVFAVLLIGGIALSLSSAPPLAQQQLHDGATATLSASGFALVDTNSVSAATSGPAAPGSAETVVFRVLYQAPDAVEESEVGPGGETMSIILIGDRRFQGSSSQWTALPASRGAGAGAVKTILSPLQAAASATKVTAHGDLYSFVPTSSDRFLAEVLGVRASQLSSPHLTAVVRAGSLIRETITATYDHERLGVDLVFSRIDSAPAVTAPPSSLLVPGPASSTPTAP
jgi:hypothetical protein